MTTVVDNLVGQRLTAVRPMTPAELEGESWRYEPWNPPLALEFEDGTVLYASQDGEGNGPGMLFGFNPGGPEGAQFFRLAGEVV